VPVIAATVLQILIEEWQAEGNSLPTLSAKTGLPIKALREVAYRADTVDVTTADTSPRPEDGEQDVDQDPGYEEAESDETGADEDPAVHQEQ
jgi:hypothetical protein